MGLGILEPTSSTHVPGTVLLDQQAAHSESETARLKHGTGSESHLILAPQPSEDPNDPLNWSWWKKHIILMIIYFGVIVHGAVPPGVLNAGIVPVSIDLNRSFTDIATMGGNLLLATGAAGPFVSALGRKYGKRPLFVFSSIIGTVGIIVSQTASGYNALLAGRVLQGIGVAAYESLAIAAIGDLFFVHERGPRLAIIIFFLSAISNGVSIIAGVITADLGWHYNFHIYLPFAALQTIMVIVYCPETTYRRSAIYETDILGSQDNLERLATTMSREAQAAEESGSDSANAEKTATETTTPYAPIPPKKTYLQELKIYNGVFVQDSIIKMFLGCIAILLNVGALYQILLTGLVVAWFVCMSLLTGVVFAAPPFAFATSTIGYMSAGPLIGGAVGAIFSFLTSEPLVKFTAKRNNGVYEPEFCLIPVSLGCVCTVAGLVGWGFAIQNVENIYVICFLWGLTLFGMTVLATFATQWVLDGYRQHSTEIFVMNIVFKNFFYYGTTYYTINWFYTQGPVPMVGVMAGISAFMSVLAIPMYIYGKKYRLWWHKNNLLKKLNLETDHLGAE